eukprot:TRINITY_DN1394_c0_g1_i1.p1 TRINITY_DN1394_c0_g1~~TRINITY_DN1394_c0_g1_i1.p1  ORF type:complete len:112 (+),score=31.09 TRINITY_DN1394_c0_g1_i1:141-476(+)
MSTAQKSGLALGLNKGFRIVKRAAPARARDTRKGKLGPGKVIVKEVIREVTGYAPYEKRILELLRNGLDKKALRLAKRRVGTHNRAKKKREEMAHVLRMEKQRKKDAAEHH